MRIFISYIRKAQPFIEELAMNLREAGFDVFFDKSLIGGQRWWDELLRQIEICDAFIPVLTKDYPLSRPCKLEAEYAASLSKPLLPIQMDRVSPRLLPRFIGDIQWVECTDGDARSLAKVIKALNSFEECPPLPNPLPQAPEIPVSYMEALWEKVISPQELTRAEQRDILGELRSRLGSEEDDDARELLQRLQERSDVQHLVAVEIDRALALTQGSSTQSSSEVVELIGDQRETREREEADLQDGQTPGPAVNKNESPLRQARGKVNQPLDALLQNQFVGREAEIGELDGILSAGSTSPALVLITGEAGIGKTSLLATFAERAADRNILCLYGRCDEESLIPYQPFVEAIRCLLHFREREILLSGALRCELARIVPEIQEFMPDQLAALDPFDPATTQGRICRAVVEGLYHLLSKGSIRLLVDDVQWADAGSLHMLRSVCTAVELSNGLAVIAAMRSDDPTAIGHVEAAIADPFHQRGVFQIRLSGLGRDEILNLIDPDATNVTSEEVGKAEVLQTFTGGNPLFATQLIRAGRETGVSEIAALLPDGGNLPFELSSVIDGRLHRLPGHVRRVLEVSAILGNSGSMAVLQATLATIGLDEEIYQAIDTAISRGFMIVDQSTKFTFTHELVRRRLVAELGPIQRKRLHLAVAESIQTVPDRELVAQIAFHRRMAAPLGDAAQAARWTLRSAIGSFYTGAFENARKELEEGVTAASRFGTQSSLECCDLLLALAGVAMAMGDNDANKELCLKAAAIARADVLTEHLALAAIQMASAGVLGSGDRDVLETCDEAISTSNILRPSVRAQLLAVAAYYESTVDGARFDHEAVTGQAMLLAETSESPESAAFVGFFRFWILVALGQVDDARELSENLLAFGNLPDIVNDEGVMGVLRASRYWGRSYARRCRFAIAMIDGDRAVMDSEVEALEATAGRGASQLRQMTTVIRVAISLLDGDLAAADSGNERVATFVGTDGNMLSAYVAQLFQLRLLQDRLNEVEPLIRSAVESSRGWAAYKVALAFCCAQRGNAREARDLLAELRSSDSLSIPRTIIRMTLLGLIAEILAELGDEHGSHEVYNLLLPYSGQFVVAGWGVVCSGSVDHFLGVLASTRGRGALALKHFDTAIERESELRAPALIADTLYWRARTQLSRGTKSGRVRRDAAESLDRCMEMADRFGLARLQRKIDELKSLNGIA